MLFWYFFHEQANILVPHSQLGTPVLWNHSLKSDHEARQKQDCRSVHKQTYSLK